MQKADMYSKQTQPRVLKSIGASVSVALVIGSMAMITQHAHAVSPLALVNGITPNGGVGVSKDILYGNQPLQDLDVYYPKPVAQAIKKHTAIGATYPMVVFVHGGSWESGNKDQYAFMGKSLAQAGYVTAVINYRKAPQHVYPDYVKDTAQAIAWSIKHAKMLHADPKRVAVMGHSAGAFNVVAAVANEDFLAPYGLKPTDIRTVVGIAGPYSYDFRKFDSANAFGPNATPDEVMPDRHIKGTQPAYFLLTGEKDETVDDSNTVKMTKALKAHGAVVDTQQIKGASHASIIGAMSPSLRWLNDVRAQVVTYLDKTL